MAVELALLVAGVLTIVLAFFLAVVTYNDVIGLQRRCERAWANIDVALKQRHDQLPALVSAVRGAMAFEQSVLEEVTNTRARYQPEAPVHDQAVVSEATSQAVSSLLAVVERYPELRSQQNVMALQEEIERLETLIARRRELFNEQVYQYNSTIQQAPAVLLRPRFGWKTVDMFSAEASERDRPTADVSVTA
ncbi:MAG TPA: LemA family protein [Candidatus Deferrimicrobium sp.]|nr:LemA family protein [Candidatus Deferrimicrobium sp.]